MDCLLRGIQSDFEETNYLDCLLQEWYEQLSNTDKTSYKGRKKELNVEFVATSKDAIAVQYKLIDKKVGIFLHRIRLSKILDSKPMVILRQNDEEIAQRMLSVHGTELACTTDSLFLPLEETSFNFDSPFQLQLEIVVNGEIEYRSADKLKREYLVFSDKGQETRLSQGECYLFCRTSSEIYGDIDFTVLPHGGQLSHFYLQELSHLVLDHEEIYTSISHRNAIHHYTNIPAEKGIFADVQGQSFLLYKHSFELNIRLPDEDNQLKYQITLDGRKILPQMKESLWTLSIHSEDMLPHTVKVVDISSQIVKYRFDYVILEECQWKYSREFYCYQKDSVEARFIFNNISQNITFAVHTELEDMIYHDSQLSFPLRLEVPFIFCEIDTKNAFLLDEYLWYEDIDAASTITILLPNSLNASVTLGGREVFTRDGKMFELGNRIRADGHQKQEELMLQWTDGNKQERQFLTNILFQDKFLKPPMFFQDDMVIWRIEGNYLGRKHHNYLISLELPSGQIYKETVDNVNCVLLTPEIFPLGEFSYKISVEKTELFSDITEEIIYNDVLITGHPHAVRMLDKQFHLLIGNYWDLHNESYQRIYLSSRAGFVKNIEYIDESCPNGESREYPHFRGTLYYVNPFGKPHEFNQGRKGGYEEINPVHLWIVNEFLLIILAETEDGLMLNEKFGTIYNITPNNEDNYEIPDYFEYKMRKENEICFTP